MARPRSERAHGDVLDALSASYDRTGFLGNLAVMGMAACAAMTANDATVAAFAV